MKTKLVYALVSSSNDYYTEQFFISAYSAKQKCNTHIVLVVDDKTEKYIKSNCSNVLNIVDELISVSYPDDLNNKLRSRYLKTTLRNIVVGDILFIDTDTLIAESLEDIDNIDADFAAVYDMHTTLKDHPSYKEIAYKAGKIGYSLKSNDEYFNSGVMFIRDNERTRNFFRQWHQNYIEGVHCGVTTDQQSFLKTCSYNNLVVKLDDIWNCQIICNVRDIYRAKILHYYCTGVHSGNPVPPYILMSTDFCSKIRENGYNIDDELIRVVENAKSAFNNPIKVFSGEELVLLNSLQFYLLRQYFFHRRNIFNKMENIIQYSRKLLR